MQCGALVDVQYLSVDSSGRKCTREFKSRISMAKAAFNKDKTLFTRKLDLSLRKKLVTC
jgi:hypothetical protein